MPSFSDDFRLPLTTKQTNISRLVTKVRYQVEKDENIIGNISTEI